MASKVYFSDLRCEPGHSLLKILEKLLIVAGIGNIDYKDKYTAIKIHFGEPGNMAYLRPGYANVLVQELKKLGARVFLTDSNTLYSGGRSNGIDHLRSASSNGYNLLSVDAPVVIADGIKGFEYRDLPVEGGEICKTARIGAAIADADIIISFSHFKGHEMTGFGGVLKNLGMGSASVAGKMYLHSDSQPFVDQELCKSCGQCIKACNHGAMHFNDNHKAEIDYSKCVGCGQCVATCNFRAANVPQNTTSINLNKKIAEYAKAVLDGKPNFHICLIIDVSPECDCWPSNDVAIVPNIGFAASFDPVALDQACADLVMKTPATVRDSMITDFCPDYRKQEHDHCHCEDKFRVIHPNTNWQSSLEHAEQIGMGSREYELIKI